jgi:hypothetical protein
VNEKRGHATSEPEDFLRLAERMNSWALMVALIGEGQIINLYYLDVFFPHVWQIQ